MSRRLSERNERWQASYRQTDAAVPDCYQAPETEDELLSLLDNGRLTGGTPMLNAVRSRESYNIENGDGWRTGPNDTTSNETGSIKLPVNLFKYPSFQVSQFLKPNAAWCSLVDSLRGHTKWYAP